MNPPSPAAPLRQKSPDARAAGLAAPQAAADGQGQAQVGAAEENATAGEDGGPSGEGVGGWMGVV